MSKTKSLSNDLLKSKMTDTISDRGQYVGNADDAPVGTHQITFQASAETATVTNLPVYPSSGNLRCSGSGCKVQEFFLQNTASPRYFIRTRWYSNAWGTWREIPEQSIQNSGGG